MSVNRTTSAAPIVFLLSLLLAAASSTVALAQSEEPAEAPEASPEAPPAPDTAAATEVEGERPSLQREAPDPPTAPPAEEAPAEEAPARPGMTLAEAQRIALERSPSLRAAMLEIDRADASIRQGWGYLLPSLGASATYVMADQPTVANFDIGGMSSVFGDMGEIVIRNQHTAQLGLNARLPLFSGRAIPALLMAHDARDLTEVTIEQARRQMALAVAQAFYATITARRTVDLLDRQIELAQEHLAASRARLEAQAGLAIDVARAELEVETLRNQRENSVLFFTNARDSVALLLAMPPEELPPLAEPVPEAQTVDGVDELVARAFRERLDLEAGRGQIQIAERDLQGIWMSFLPSLDLSWSLTHTLTELGGFGDRRTQWNLAVVASFPLFDGGIRYGQLRDRRARLEQARLNQEALEQSVAIEVRQAFRAWRTSMITFEISQRQLGLARDAHRLAVAAYEAGAASNLEVVDAQRALANAEVDLELQRLSSQLSLVMLFASLEVSAAGGMGGGGAAPSGGSSAGSSSMGGGGMPAGATAGGGAMGGGGMGGGMP